MAASKVLTEVMSWVLVTAVSEKLTIPIWLPAPIVPLDAPSVAVEMAAINCLAPAWILDSGAPVILAERSSIRTISAGLVWISGAARIATVTFVLPSQSI